MQEITLDLQDYSSDARVIRRTAVRGIIRCGGKYLLVQGIGGDCKFPGGGAETGETHLQTLCREVQEETGYSVRCTDETAVLLVHERRCGQQGWLLEMDSYYYICTVSDAPTAQHLDAYEAARGYAAVWLTEAEALARMQTALSLPDMPWAEREELVLRTFAGRQREDWQRLYDAAKAVLAPRRISEYVTAGEVAAAVMSKSGSIYTGVCVDTCSTLGICAERSAIFAMLTAGEQAIDKVLCILPDGSCGAPCGACRELMVQLMAGRYYGIEFMMDRTTGKTMTLGELTPEWWIS